MKIENSSFLFLFQLFHFSLRLRFFFIVFSVLFTQALFAQSKTDSTEILSKKDTIEVLSKTDSIVLKHSPTKATLLSVVVPGAGQFYNKKYWKIPVIYAGIAAAGYFVRFNDVRYQDYKKAYAIRLDGDDNTVDQYVDIYSDDNLKTLKDFYRRNRDLSYIVGGLIYILNILDADVDAHLFYFDVGDDLSFHLQPSVNYSAQSKPVSGLSLTFNF